MGFRPSRTRCSLSAAWAAVTIVTDVLLERDQSGLRRHDEFVGGFGFYLPAEHPLLCAKRDQPALSP
jgi:hypothetical protein